MGNYINLIVTAFTTAAFTFTANFLFYKWVKTRIDKQIESYKIVYTGVVKERITIYRELYGKIYELKINLYKYYHSGELPQGNENIFQVIGGLYDYCISMRPFLSNAVIDALEQVFRDFRIKGSDISKYHRARSPNRMDKNYEKILDAYYSHEEDLLEPESNLGKLINQVEVEMRKDLGTN